MSEKTRREILIDAGVPAEELALIESKALDEAPDDDEDYPCMTRSATALLQIGLWWRTRQGDGYWRHWHAYLGGFHGISSAPRPGPSGPIRRKTTVTVPEHEIPQPLTEEPEDGARYWVFGVDGKAGPMIWEGDDFDLRNLRLRRAYRTAEDCEAAEQARAEALGGGL